MLTQISIQTEIIQENASSHKSSKANAGTAFVPRDLDFRPFDPKINGFPELMVEHFYVKFGDASCIGFCEIVRMNKPTKTNAG